MAIDPALVAALRGAAQRHHHLATFTLPGGVHRFWDGVGDITVDGDTYRGTGLFGRVEYGSDALSEVAEAFTLTLSGALADQNGDPVVLDGFEAAVTQTLRGERLQGASVRVARIITDLEAVTVIGQPITVVEGIVDRPVLEESDAGFPQLTMTIENRSLRARRVAPQRFSAADHKLINPGSDFMRMADQLNTVSLPWGASD